MPTVVTLNFRYLEALQQINLSADTFYVSLMNSYVSATSATVLRNITTWSEVSANEITGGGYSRATLTTKTLTKDTSIGKVLWDADDISWSSITAEIYGYCVYRSDGAVVGFVEFTGTTIPIVISNGAFSLNWNTLGIMNLT